MYRTHLAFVREANKSIEDKYSFFLHISYHLIIKTLSPAANDLIRNLLLNFAKILCMMLVFVNSFLHTIAKPYVLIR